MYYIRIDFTPNTNFPLSEEIENRVWRYMGALLRGGQITEEYDITVNRDTEVLSAFVNAPEEDSLLTDFTGEDAFRCLKGVKEYFDVEFEVLGENLNRDPACACADPSAYYIKSPWWETQGPIFCMDCNKPVPLYTIARLDPHADHNDLFRWRAAHHAVHRMLDFGPDKEYAIRQLSDPFSLLSKRGMYLANRYELQLERPVYYTLFSSEVSASSVSMRSCPRCKHRWFFLDDTGSGLLQKCPFCRIVVENVDADVNFNNFEGFKPQPEEEDIEIDFGALDLDDDAWDEDEGTWEEDEDAREEDEVGYDFSQAEETSEPAPADEGMRLSFCVPDEWLEDE